MLLPVEIPPTCGVDRGTAKCAGSADGAIEATGTRTFGGGGVPTKAGCATRPPAIGGADGVQPGCCACCAIIGGGGVDAITGVGIGCGWRAGATEGIRVAGGKLGCTGGRLTITAVRSS